MAISIFWEEVIHYIPYIWYRKLRKAQQGFQCFDSHLSLISAPSLISFWNNAILVSSRWVEDACFKHREKINSSRINFFYQFIVSRMMFKRERNLSSSFYYRWQILKLSLAKLKDIFFFFRANNNHDRREK